MNIEVMKQVVEALKTYCIDYVTGRCKACHTRDGHTAECPTNNLLAALRSAIAEQEKQMPVADIIQANEVDGDGVLTHQRDVDYYQADIDELPVGTKLYTHPAPSAPPSNAALAEPTSGDYALGYCEGFNDACKPKPQAEPEGRSEPVVLEWSPAPHKTKWGCGMVVADIEIDRHHTLTLYCEEDQVDKVKAMFSSTHLAEPVAWLCKVVPPDGHRFTENPAFAAKYEGVPLYTHPAPSAPPLTPPGYVLVPREPTEDMLYAAEISKVRGYTDLYKAMLAAAPKVQSAPLLTDEEIVSVMNACLNDWDWIEFARAIERRVRGTE